MRKWCVDGVMCVGGLQVFNTSKDEFQAMPLWKRDLLKKKKGLF